jgi:hypothetical protein
VGLSGESEPEPAGHGVRLKIPTSRAENAREMGHPASPRVPTAFSYIAGIFFRTCGLGVVCLRVKARLKTKGEEGTRATYILSAMPA